MDYACQFIGNPYVWGGTSLTNGADCSGFVQSVFAHFGISLPRTTWDMEV
ncbi:MAG: C40 family peptidase [[Clostridium] scindens]